MPLRNLLLIALTAAISVLCYSKVERNRYSAIISEVMGVVERSYVEPVHQRELFEHAMDGMLTGLDPYSGYIPPRQYGAFRESIEQRFGGIGILVEINPDTKRPMVMTPLFDTPAYEAGIQPGDQILKIDDHDTEGLDLRQCVDLMRGPPGTKVKLEIVHRGETEPVELTLRRTIIHTETVLGDKRLLGAKWDFHLQEDPRIGYIRLTSFGDETVDELVKALTDDQGNYAGYEALILDMRNNPGGTLNAAVDVCNMFLTSGVIVSTRGRDGKPKETYRADSSLVVPPEIPVTVLINQYSASASEIVAACLQDHGRAKIVGQRTWGKGTVQNVIELERGRSALRLTTSSYWRPSNQNIHRRKDAKETDQWGVSPDAGFEVKLTDDEFQKVQISRAERDSMRPYLGERRRQERQEEAKPDSSQQQNGDKPEGESAEEKPPEDDEPFDDPQLRKAIEHLQQRLRQAAEVLQRA